jgi:biotin synthase
MLLEFAEKNLIEAPLSRDEALRLASLEGPDVMELFSAANRLRDQFRGRKVDLCSIVSAKTGACKEDCSYCAQSRVSTAEIETHSLIDSETILERARAAKESGVKRFCIVTGGRRSTDRELETIAEMIGKIRNLGLLPCATLGLLGLEDLKALKEAGLHRYHHNIETSRRFFPEICTTHTYDQKLMTIEASKSAGLSLCSGGIFGMGESWEDRVDMAIELRELGVDSVPINFLVPIKGTPLENLDPMAPIEALKIISLMRFIMPDREIRVCGGRFQTLGELNSFVFTAGADGLLTGDCLTTKGASIEHDLRLVEQLGLEIG